MDSRSSRPTQPDSTTSGSFRVKLRVTHVIISPGYGLGEYLRPVRERVDHARYAARIWPGGPEERALRRVGLEP